MIFSLKFIIIIAASLFFTNCERDAEVQPKEYPYVITNSPTVNSNGAEFSADITNIGNQEILKYGFVELLSIINIDNDIQLIIRQ